MTYEFICKMSHAYLDHVISTEEYAKHLQYFAENADGSEIIKLASDIAFYSQAS